jgi:hypothetical protein
VRNFLLIVLFASFASSSNADEAPASPLHNLQQPSKLAAAKTHPGIIFTISRRVLGRLNGSVVVDVELREVKDSSDANKRTAVLVLEFKDPLPMANGGMVYIEEEDFDGLVLALGALSRVQHSNQIDNVTEMEFGTRSGVVFKTTSEASGRRRFEILPTTIYPNRHVFSLEELAPFRELLDSSRIHLKTAAAAK